ncbi:vitamin K-dependent protein C-like [Anopheles darlingi]|uniref:vitamin K-dependent protein C-like n=1 Tax=Anopheles darlingi TaxID=43151 RepID=UPI0021005906|nr:vitamin K-dependent protein C-like [Anopheles darlingi]
MEVEVLELLLGYYHLDEEPDADCSVRLGVRKIHIHPEYKPHRSKHDIALLELEQEVPFTDRILPICLGMAKENASNFLQVTSKVPCWDSKGFNRTSSQLYITEISIATDGQRIYPDVFCGGLANESNNCYAESGGGLVTRRQDHWELVGILSHTEEKMDEQCTNHKNSAYLKVQYYSDWIASVCTDHVVALKEIDDSEIIIISVPSGLGTIIILIIVAFRIFCQNNSESDD